MNIFWSRMTDTFTAVIITVMVCLTFITTTAAAAPDFKCPVCIRIINTVADSSLTKAGKASISYERYCALTSISVEETQFCYNTNGIKAEIHRMLDLGASADRICRKVNKVNSDFCTTRESDFVFTLEENPDSQPLSAESNNSHFKPKRGFIYI